MAITSIKAVTTTTKVETRNNIVRIGLGLLVTKTETFEIKKSQIYACQSKAMKTPHYVSQCTGQKYNLLHTGTIKSNRENFIAAVSLISSRFNLGSLNVIIVSSTARISNIVGEVAQAVFHHFSSWKLQHSPVTSQSKNQDSSVVPVNRNTPV